MSFDSEVEKLLKDYNLFYPDADIRYLNRRTHDIEEHIRSLFTRCLANRKVVIRGGGKATKELLEIIADIPEKERGEIVYIVDKYIEEDNIFGIPVVRPGDISLSKIDIVLITSFKYRTEFRKEFNETEEKLLVIDLYDYLAIFGFFFDGDFYAKIDLRLFYLTINYYKNKYETNQKGEKSLYLKKLISCYLSIRDFYNAFKCIEEYETYYDKKILILKDKLIKLLSLLKTELEKKRKKHIIMFWLDQLRYKDISQMSFLTKYSEDKIFFEKCYTQNLQTSTTFKMMFSGKDVLDDKSYQIDKINESNSPVYTTLKNNGYDFRYIGWGKNNVYFDGISSYPLEKDNCILPLNIWNMFMDVLFSEGKSLYLLHSFEAHEHHFCGYMTRALYNIQDSTFKQFLHRYEECVRYIDEQLRFYLQFFNEQWSTIIMSDHGQELENVYKFDENVNDKKEKYKYGRWSEDSLHTVMIINDSRFKSKKVKGLFSLVQFGEIIDTLLTGKWKISEKKFIKIQSMPFYSEDGIKKIEECKDYRFAMLVKGVIYNNKKYLKYASGEEEFYQNGDDESNIFMDEYKNDIEECRKLCGDIDYSIFEDIKFKAAKKVLEITRKLSSDKGTNEDEEGFMPEMKKNIGNISDKNENIYMQEYI